MIQAGFTIENPTTKSRTVVLESDLETKGMGWLLEIHCPPGAEPDIAEHYHRDWIETFEIISGTAYYKLNGVQKMAQAGEKIVMPPGQLQIHPWNAGETEMVYRQRDQFAKADPQAVQDVLGVFATLAGLTREGKVGADGRPKNPLQAAVTLRTLVKYGGYDASIPANTQYFIGGTLGALADLFGYKAVYPQYVGEK